MTTRIHFDSEDAAVEAAEILDDNEYEVAVIKERFAGEDDDEEIVWVVATTADEVSVREFLDLDDEAWVEVDE
ncbi:MAG: hypothetical protein ACRDAX_02600 [Propionibacteriaceae bacterium]